MRTLHREENFKGVFLGFPETKKCDNTVKRPKFDTLFGENIFFLLIFLADPLSNFLEVCLKFLAIS